MAEGDAGELETRLLERISRDVDEPMGDAEFDALALAVFAHQYACNAPYRAFCDRRGATPDTVARWSDVPAVPTDAFKAAALVCGDPAEAEIVFRTSGTTAGRERRGEHHLPSLRLYDAALRAGFAAHLLPDGARPRILSLVPPPAELPDSSLSHMVAEVMRDFGAPGSGWFVTAAGGIDLDGLRAAVEDARAAGDVVCVPGTAFAFVHLADVLDAAGDALPLPRFSRVMDTGGFKGRSREVGREELYGMIRRAFDVSELWCVNEYGMTEMSSQFYDGIAGGALPPAERLHAGPPWVRTQAADPETLSPLPHGEVGVLRHWDLANLGSVMAIQTADLGITEPGGFRVLGRASGATARGCSIAMDDLLSAIGRS